MKFTIEQRKKIDKLLEEGEEMQRKTGNKLYTLEEVWGTVLEQYYKDIQKINNY